MTEDELADVLRRVGESRTTTAPAPPWDRLQARRAERRRRVWWRRAAVGTVAAAALGAVALRMRPTHDNQHMSVASAIVIQRHLAQSDTMIGVFRSAVAGGTWDDDLTARARDLELATRRIEDEQVTNDSTFTGLLTDLDLVFTEIAGYADVPTGRATESAMIEYSLAVRHVVPRLRSARADVAALATTHEGLTP